MLAAFCFELVFGGSRKLDVATRLAYRFHHLYNWPAWFYFAALGSGLVFLSAHLVAIRFGIALRAVDGDERRFPIPAVVCLALVLISAFAIGETAMRMAITNGW